MAGFDWEDARQIIEKIKEELNELEEAFNSGERKRIEEELGDIIFSSVNFGRFLSINPEDALHATISRFQKRFSHMESTLEKQGKSLNEAEMEELERLWCEAKELGKQI